MRVAALAQLPIGMLMWAGAQPMLTVVVKASFRLEADGRATMADLQLPLHEDGPPGASPLHNSCDFVPHKTAVDLLVVGSARAPKSAAQLPVRIALPPVLDRRCIATAGSPTKRLPLSPHYLRGLDGPPTTTGPATMPHDVRKNPDLGPNFDFASFNVAPRSQRIPQLLPGTTIQLEGLLGRGAPVNVTIPALAPFVFYVQAPAPWQPLRMVCDTVWFDTDRAMMSLTWRGLRTMPERLDGAFLVLTSSAAGPPDPAQLEAHLGSARWGEIGPAQPPVLQRTRRSAGVPEGGAKASGASTLSFEDAEDFRAAVLPFLEGGDRPPLPVDETDDADETLTDDRSPGKSRRARGATLDSVPIAMTGQGETATPFEPPLAPGLPSSSPAPSAPGYPSAPSVPSAPERSVIKVEEAAPETKMPDTVMATTAAAQTVATYADAVPAPSPSAPGQDTRAPDTAEPETEPTTVPKEESASAPETVKRGPRVGAQTMNIEDLERFRADLPFAKDAASVIPPHVAAALSQTDATQKGETMAFEAISAEEALPFLQKAKEARRAQAPSAPAGQDPISATPAPPTPPMQAPAPGARPPVVPYPSAPPARSAPPIPPPIHPAAGAPPARPSAPAAAPSAAGSHPAQPAPRVSEPSLPLPIYAAIKASALDGQTVSPKLLAKHDLDEAAWRAAERRMTVALAHDDGSLADELAAAVAQARREQTGPPDELDVEAYVAIRAEVEESDDAKATLRALGLDEAQWETMRRDWTKRALADRELARAIRSQLAEARRALRKVRG